MKRTNQQGFGFVVVLIAVVVIGLVAFAAVRISGSKTTVADSAQSSASTGKIKSQADLTKASKELDATPIDSGVGDAQLDSDIKALL